jgi:uncharacterized phage-associated protein
MEATRNDSHEGLTFGTNDEESRERLRELILYIAAKSEGDPHFGATKLNKLLFYADFISFAKSGRPLTDAQYKKHPYGPVPTSVDSVKAELTESGDAAVVLKGLAPYTQQRIRAQREARLNEHFTPSEISLVDEVIQTLRDLNASEVSEMSHDFAWQIAGDYELIPYDAVFIYDRELSDHEINRAHELAAKYEWQV